jgi:hypothetical protein
MKDFNNRADTGTLVCANNGRDLSTSYADRFVGNYGCFGLD